jgi:hypothetical protein
MRANERAYLGRGDPPADDTVPGLGGTYAAELRGIVDHAFCFSEKYGEQQMRADRFKAQPDVLEFERKLIKRCRKLGIPLFAHCVNRSAEEQTRLYVKGVTKANAGESPHNYGCAVDLVHGTKAWGLTRKQWEVIGHLGKELAIQNGLKVTWGGDWSFYDPAHWELTNWREIRALLSQSGLY